MSDDAPIFAQYREDWKARGRELNALYDVIAASVVGEPSGDPVADLQTLVAYRAAELAKARMALAEMERQRDEARGIVADLTEILGSFPLDRAMRVVHIANRHVAEWRKPREEG